MLAKLVLLTAMFTALPAWALVRVFVEPVRGSGVTDADRESVEELIKVAVPQVSGFTLTPSRENAQVLLAPSLMKLGDAYILTVQKKNASGAPMFAEKMKAKSLDEIDTISERVTRAALTETSTASTQDVTNVAQNEVEGHTRRVNATRQWMFGFGPSWPTNLASAGGGAKLSIGYLWGVDPDWSVGLVFDRAWGRKDDNSSWTDLLLGADYHFSRSRMSPFVGARLGWGSGHVDGDKCNILSIGCSQDRASGWALSANAGLKFFRTSSVNMSVFATYTRVFDVTSLGEPSLTSLQLAVYF